MTLNDSLRAKTREVEDAIRGVEEKLAQLNRERVAALERAQRAREEASRHDLAKQERRRSVEDVERRIREIEEQIHDLRSRLEILASEREKVRGTVTESEQEASGLRKERQREEAEATRLQEEIERTEAERQRHQERFAEARRAALVEYNLGVWKRLLAMAQSQEKRAHVRQAAQALESARHDKPEVAALCEARQQWRSILSGDPVPMVKDAAWRELASVEQEIERWFPGALEAEGLGKQEGELEELYWYRDEGHSVIFVPIPTSLYDAIGEPGAVVQEETLAMGLVFSLGRSELVSKGIGEITRTDAGIVLHSSDWIGSEEGDLVNVALGDNAPISFMLAPLPMEVREVLR